MSRKEKIEITVDKNLSDSRRDLALKISDRLHSKNIKSFDVMGSVGAGKTTLIKRIVESLDFKVGVIAADLTTEIDKKRIAESGAKVLQINTVKMCHLDGEMILKTLGDFEDVDVSSNQAAADEMIKKSGQMGVPVLDINGQIITGFDKQAISKALGIG